MNVKYIIGCLMACIVATAAIHAQPEQVSETTVELEGQFIEATKYRILREYDKAAELYQQILLKDPTNHAAAYELARLYDVLDDANRAVRMIKVAVELDPTNTWYRIIQSELLQQAGRNAEAAAVYAELSKQEPGNLYYIEERARLNVAANRPKEAIALYDQLEKQDGINIQLTEKKYRLYLDMGQTRKAAREIESLIKAYPDEPDYYHLLAEFYKQTGDDKKAQSTYKRILEIDPDDSRAQLALAKQSTGGDSELAYLVALRPVFAKTDVSIDDKIKQLIGYIDIAASSTNPELRSEALALAELLTKTHPTEAKAFSMYGDFLYRLGQPEEAFAAYQRTLELDNSVFAVYDQMMLLLAEAGQYDKLADFSESTMDYFPNQARVYYWNGIALAGQDDAQGALNVYREALMMAGRNAPLKYDILIRQAAAHHQLKQYDQADQSLESALELNANSPEALHNYAYYLSERNTRLTDAAKMAAQANELATGVAPFESNYGRILYQLGDYDKAKKWLDRALQSGGNRNPRTLEHYGDLLYQLDDRDQAVQYWERAKQAGSDSPTLEQKIAQRKLLK